MRGRFRRIVIVDFEYEIAPGGLPKVLCMVAYVLNANLEHVQTIRLWRGEFGSRPPFDTGPDTLFCAFAAWAELIVFLQLGWEFPEHILDLHTAYLALSNILAPHDYSETQRRKEQKGLPDACAAYGIRGWERFAKKTIAKDIGEGRWQVWGQPVVFDYNEEDVARTLDLLRAMLRGPNRLGFTSEIYRVTTGVDIDRVIDWSNYSAKAVAKIQARGMPIDMHYWNVVQENKALVVGELIRQHDPSFGMDRKFRIYTDDGEWTYEGFANWLIEDARRRGVPVTWPYLESGRLDVSSDAFKMMASSVPGAESIHALRDSLGFIAKARLPIGPDGRNRPSLFPFATATGRNAHAKSPFNAHAGVRGFILFPPESIGFYLDWRSQEVAIAAAIFHDDALRAAYESGDVYHALALLCGLTTELDPAIWRERFPEMRERMKVLQLGIGYGMGVRSLARSLDRHPLIAAEILRRYAQRYPKFWERRSNAVENALLDRIVRSRDGWPLHLSNSPNPRSLLNFPMQANGAAMLREGTVRLVDAGIVPVMLIHDGVLFQEADAERIPEAIDIMRAVGRELCNGIDVGADVVWSTVKTGSQRFADKRPKAISMWRTIEDTLRAIGAISKKNVA